MQTKLFEVRDHATCMIVLAVRPECADAHEAWMWRRSGYGKNPESYVLLAPVDGSSIGHMEYDPYQWRRSGEATLFQAHQYVLAHFGELQPGQVIDLRVVRGETKEAVASDRYYVP